LNEPVRGVEIYLALKRWNARKMKNDGEVVAILNAELVLVRASDAGAFRENRRFRVYENVSIGNEDQSVSQVQVPKGTLTFEADQEDPDLFLLRVVVHQVTDTRRESPLGIAASGIADWMVPKEVSVTREASRSANLSSDQSLGISVGAVKVGDNVCAIDSE